jgi:hypothetical protein
MTVIRPRQLSSLPLGAAIAALVLSVGATRADANRKKADRASSRAVTLRQAAVARRRLRARLKRNPRAALSRDFLQKAAASGLNLPLTLRLNRPGQDAGDNELMVQWDDSTWPWPANFLPLQPDPGGGVVALNGRSSMVAQFGSDLSGYGGVGAVETLNGTSLAFDGVPAAPIGVSNFASPVCPAPGVAIQMRRLDLSTGEATHGLLSLFGGVARVSLHVRVGTTSRVLNPDCSGDLDAAGDNRHDANGSDPIVPINFDAVFRISPSITSDGNLRFGVLTVADGSAQPTSFARITVCTASAPTPNTCPTEQFPARLSIKRMNAEVLLGDLPS